MNSRALKPISGEDSVAEHLEQLMRANVNAPVAAIAGTGLIVPIPPTLPYWGSNVIQARSLFDIVVSEDRSKVAKLWAKAQELGEVTGPVRLMTKKESSADLHLFDVRKRFGVFFGVLTSPGGSAGTELITEVNDVAATRFATLYEDESGKVIDCDQTYLKMFGLEEVDIIGKTVLDQIHPDDQGRAIESWLTMLGTFQTQHARVRRRKSDGTWLWTDVTMHNYLNHPTRNYAMIQVIDVSAEMEAQEALSAREDFLRHLTESLPIGVMVVNPERKVTYLNTRIQEMLSMPPLAGPIETDAPITYLDLVNCLSGLGPASSSSISESVRKCLDSGHGFDIEIDVIRSKRRNDNKPESSSISRCLFSLRPTGSPEHSVSGVVVCVMDVTESARLRGELEYRATFDELTGCLNRSAILGVVESEVAEDKENFGVIFVDLDGFKKVNDTHGHVAGDELLRTIGKRLRSILKEGDTVGRIGGDEFLVVCKDLSRIEDLTSVARRVQGSFAHPVSLGKVSLKVQASIGGSVYCPTYATGEIRNSIPPENIRPIGGPGAIAERLVASADTAMYRSKKQGLGIPKFSFPLVEDNGSEPDPD